MAWSDAARAAAAEARRRKAAGLAWRSRPIRAARQPIEWDREEGVARKVEMVDIDSLSTNKKEVWSGRYRRNEGKLHIAGLQKAIFGRHGENIGSRRITALAVRLTGGKLTVIDGQHRYNLLRRVGVRRVGVQISK